MTDTGDIFGGIIGLGIGLYTLKFLNNLSQKNKTEIEKILGMSKRSGKYFVVKVRNSNLTKARRILKISGFVIDNEVPIIEEQVTNIHYTEKMK